MTWDWTQVTRTLTHYIYMFVYIYMVLHNCWNKALASQTIFVDAILFFFKSILQYSKHFTYLTLYNKTLGYEAEDLLSDDILRNEFFYQFQARYGRMFIFKTSPDRNHIFYLVENFGTHGTCKNLIITDSSSSQQGCPRDAMVKALDSGIVVSEFERQSRYYVHFWTNTLAKGMNPLILPAMC